MFDEPPGKAGSKSDDFTHINAIGYTSARLSPLVHFELAGERQGEAISYTADGTAIVTTGEKIPAPIYQFKRIGASPDKNRMPK